MALFVSLLIVFGVWAALGVVWREWPAFGLGAFLFLVALFGLIGMTERRRIGAFRVLTVLTLLALIALAETAVQKIVVGALDSSPRDVGIGFAWLALAVAIPAYYARTGWLSRSLSLFRRRE